MPLFGPPNIEKLAANRDVKGLVKVLKGQPEAQLRGAAVQALLQIGDREAVEPLYEARADENPGVRALVAIALGYFGDPRAVPLLVNSIDIGGEISIKLIGMLGGAQAVRSLARILENAYHAKSDANIIAAAEMLVNIGDEQAIQPLIHALRVCNDAARPAMIKALTAFGAPAVGPLIATLTEGRQSSNSWHSIREELEEVFLALDAPARDGLVDSLDQSTNLGLLKDKVAILSKMEGGLDSPQAKAVNILVNGDKEQIAALGPEAEGLLLKLWGAEGGEPRLTSLMKIWGPEAAERLIGLLDEGALFTGAQREAVEMLGSLGDEKAIPCLAAIMQQDSGVRATALEALRRFNTPKATRAFESLFESTLDLTRYISLREDAVKALAERNYTPRRDKAGAVYHLLRGEWDRFTELGEEIIAPLVEEVLDRYRSLETIEMLENINDPRSVDRLIGFLDSWDAKERMAVCHALGKKGDARAVEALKKVESYDSYIPDSGSSVSNPWAYDHTGGGTDYWSEEAEKSTYPVREAARHALEMIREKGEVQ